MSSQLSNEGSIKVSDAYNNYNRIMKTEYSSNEEKCKLNS